jgi:parvulin-like peptidyl-prolyl isomerase
MTLRARPTTRTGRRSGYESDARRNLYFNIGFGAVVVVAILLLAGAAAASWYGEHLAAVAVVNGESITKDAERESVALETFRLNTLDSRTREKVSAGRMAASQGQQLLTYISQQMDQISNVGLERAIDTTLLLQLASKRGIEVTPAEIDAQVTKDATTPESRHAFVIAVTPVKDAGATTPTQAEKDAAKKKSDGFLADLKGGKTWEEVVKASGDAAAADTNGDLFFLDKGTTSPDAPFVEAIFGLAAPGFTAVVEGADGVYRIGRMTEISAQLVDPNHMKRVADAGISEAAYRRSAGVTVARDKIDAQLLAEVVDKPSEQRRTAEIAIEDNGGSPIAPGAVLVKHLLFSPKNDPGGAAALPPDDPAWKVAEEAAAKAHGELKAGTKRFVDLAPSSDDATSAAANGYLPYFVKDDPSTQLDKAFSDAIFAPGLVPGQLLAPVKSAFGWHVIEFVSADDPVVRAQKLSAEASKPGADVARLAADNSIAPSAVDGGDLGWIARYQLAKAQEDVIFATQANGVSVATQGTGTGAGLVFYVVTEIATRLPDPEQAKTLHGSAFVNWYQGIKDDPAQTKIERLTGG